MVDFRIISDIFTSMDILKFFIITPEILKLIAEIDEFKGAWKALGALAPERLYALKRVATIESIGASTRIEGSKLSDIQVESLLSEISVRTFDTTDAQEVAGYADVIETIFNHYQHIPLTENHIKQLHRDLLQYSVKDEKHRGDYKVNRHHISAFDTPYRVQALIQMTNDAFEQEKLHPLLVISIFIVRFLEIHPFQGGNGRLSRILTTLLLLKHGYVYVPYGSLEYVIEQNKEDYYHALRRTQLTILTQNPDFHTWIIYFLKALQQQKQKLDLKIARERIILGQLSELSFKILEIVREHGRSTLNQLVILTDANRHTVKKHLQSLVAAHHLSQHGVGKSTWYERFIGEKI